MDTVFIFRHDELTSNPVKSKGISSTSTTNNRLERCHAKSKQQQAKRVRRENHKFTLNWVLLASPSLPVNTPNLRHPIQNLIISFLLEHRQPQYFLEVGRPVNVAHPTHKFEPPLTVQVENCIQSVSAAPEGGGGGGHHHGVGEKLPPDLVKNGSQ